jgi:hypothetical protein
LEGVVKALVFVRTKVVGLGECRDLWKYKKLKKLKR